MRKISACMATQHPDNADIPYWQTKAFVSTAREVQECYLCFSDLGIDEYNWDWEGKFVDEAVIDRLIHKHFRYFQKHPLGKDKFLTFRIPNPKVEKQFRLARAFMVIITSSQFMQSLGLYTPPIFETILPLTETAEEIIEIQQAFRELIRVEHRLLQMTDSIKHIEIIPLFEQVGKIIDAADLIRRYLKIHKKLFGFSPSYLRPYCARSDPALNSGLVPTILALKVALSSFRQVEQETGVALYPMLGTGSLPFRGGLTPDSIEKALDEYAGITTLVIQSAFRYDYPLSRVKKAIIEIKKELPKRRARCLTYREIQSIRKTIPYFENPYRHSIEKLAPLINLLSQKVARRRERMLHIGLFGYSRGIGNIKLPRAIPFTASLYSLGIPPEFIGTGRGIKNAKLWASISSCYLHLKDDLTSAGYFLNKENLARLAKTHSFWYDIMNDIIYVEKEFNMEFGPKTAAHREHYQISKKIYDNLEQKKDISQLITYGGILRKSLG